MSNAFQNCKRIEATWRQTLLVGNQAWDVVKVCD